MFGSRKGWIKFAVQAVVGGVTGFVCTTLLLKTHWFGQIADNAGALALLLVGVTYLLCGVTMYLPSLHPRLGAKFLFVADEEELRELRPIILASGIVMGAIGAGQILLVLAHANAVPPLLGAMVMFSSIVLAIAVTVAQWRQYDEFWKQVSMEGSQYTLWAVLVALIGWATLAQFGWVPAINPLGLIALLMGLALVCTMIAAQRRGMARFD